MQANTRSREWVPPHLFTLHFARPLPDPNEPMQKTEFYKIDLAWASIGPTLAVYSECFGINANAFFAGQQPSKDNRDSDLAWQMPSSVASGPVAPVIAGGTPGSQGT